MRRMLFPRLGSHMLSFSVDYYKNIFVEPLKAVSLEVLDEFSCFLLAVWFLLHAMLEVDYEQLLDHLGVAFGNPQNGVPHLDLAQACMRALGPNGEGVVAVRGMKDYESLRGRLLPLAHKLALLPHAERLKILKEQGLGTDVAMKSPDRLVSSFAAQLHFESAPEHSKYAHTPKGDLDSYEDEEDSFCNLGYLFNQLGMCMVEVGLAVARLCDVHSVNGNLCGSEAGLEHAIKESGTAKGRLIHYHSRHEQYILSKDLKTSKQKKNSNRAGNELENCPSKTEEKSSDPGLVPTSWQQWHCDYGILTVLTSPLFLKAALDHSIDPCKHKISFSHINVHSNTMHGKHGGPGGRIPSITAHMAEMLGKGSRNTKSEIGVKCQSGRLVAATSGLIEAEQPKRKLFVQSCEAPDGHSALQIMDTHGKTAFLTIPTDCLLVQVGEAAEILSGGELVAQAHCVTRPTQVSDVSRETMAVFLHPAWNRVLTLPPQLEKQSGEEMLGGLSSMVEAHIPKLASRWKNGCTFAEFSKKTTNKYYGVEGCQSRRY